MTPHPPGLDFLVRPTDLRVTCVEAASGPDDAVVDDGGVLFRVDAFGFSANNITYASTGESLRYFEFFPAKEGWAKIPVWGFGEAVVSRCHGVTEGARYFGFFPTSRYVHFVPTAVGAAGFVDGAPHRATLPSIYNQYALTSADPAYRPGTEDVQMLLRPLFMTSFLLDSYLDENRYFGARSVVLSSASSKTAYGLAFLIHRRASRPALVGLTSAGNAGFVRSLGCYDAVATYDDVASLGAEGPVVYVDFAGNAGVTAAVHRRFEGALAYSCAVGVTHWERRAPAEALPGPAPKLFFAPDHARTCLAAWGARRYGERFAEAWGPFLEKVQGGAVPWMRVTRGRGGDAVAAVYHAMLVGTASPADGHILSL